MRALDVIAASAVVGALMLLSLVPLAWMTVLPTIGLLWILGVLRVIVEISERRALAIELLDRVAKIAADEAEIERLKDKLKALATSAGKPFAEGVDGKGLVKVRPATAGAFKGLMPVLDPELYLAADPAEQERLRSAGLVRLEGQYGRGAYASVSVELAPA